MRVSYKWLLQVGTIQKTFQHYNCDLLFLMRRLLTSSMFCQAVSDPTKLTCCHWALSFWARFLPAQNLACLKRVYTTCYRGVCLPSWGLKKALVQGHVCLSLVRCGFCWFPARKSPPDQSDFAQCLGWFLPKRLLAVLLLRIPTQKSKRNYFLHF